VKTGLFKQPWTNYEQDFSKGVAKKQPGKRLTRMSRETAQLARNVRDMMEIHQGKHDGVKNR
jgi:hypothetical protein